MVANTLYGQDRAEESSEHAPFGRFAPTPLQARLLRWTRRMPGSWTGRRLAMLVRRLAMTTLHAPLDDEIWGMRMRLYPFDNICEKRALFTPQFFDPVERAILSACAAVEPQPAVFERLVFNVAQNDGGTIKALRCALADRNGEITLFVESGSRGQSSMRYIESAEGSAHAIRVPARTLLGVLAEEGLERIDAIKIDVEGAEDLVLGEFLERAPEALLPSLLIVGNSRGRWQKDLVGKMEARGYHMLAQTRLNLVLERGIVHRPDMLLEAARGGTPHWG